MSCRHAKSLMSARLDNDIELEDAHILEDHLAECPNCRRFWEAMYAAGAVVREEQPLMFLRSDFTDRVMSRIEALASPVFQPPAWRKWTTLATIVSIMFTLVMVPTLATLVVWQLNPTLLIQVGAWFGNLGNSAGIWLAGVSDNGFASIRLTAQSLFQEAGMAAIGSVLLLTGTFMASYMAIHNKHQATMTGA